MLLLHGSGTSFTAASSRKKGVAPLCLSSFTEYAICVRHRLQVSVAKIRQSLPELKRDGNTVLGSVSAAMLYDENSTSRAGGVLTQMEFIPSLSEELESQPSKVLEAFEQIRSHGTPPQSRLL